MTLVSMKMESLVAAIQGFLHGARIPACSIAIVRPSGTLWCRGFGYADLETKRPAESSTVYHLFSGTKLFTATAVLQLVEAHQLDLDTEATKWLPELPKLNGIRLRHLLSHSSGLKDSLRGFLAVYFPDEEAPTTGQALARYDLRRHGEPGKKVRYCNANYAVLGELVSRVSGMPYREYVRLRILNPLASDAGFEVPEEGGERTATGYLCRWDPSRALIRLLLPSVARRLYGGRTRGLVALNPYNLGTASIGGLVGSVASFAPFLQSQLNGGAPLLSEGTTRRMQTMVAEGRAGFASRDGVGFGWKFGRAGDHAFLNHEGGGAGFTSELRLYPEAGLGIVLMMNLSSMVKTMRIAHRICELIYKQRRLFT
jgi:D-alanyl-D-alanine carboxypeptidase